MNTEQTSKNIFTYINTLNLGFIFDLSASKSNPIKDIRDL